MTVPPRDVRVCFVGDSFVAGVGDSSGLGWVGRVVAQSHRRGLPLTAYNLGVRRETSVAISERIAGELAPRMLATAESRVVAAFGVNDTVIDGDTTRVSLTDSVSALRRIAASVGEIPLALVGPPVVDDAQQNERISTLNNALRDEAARLGILFIDCVESTMGNEVWRREVRAGDGAHPDSSGYAELAAVVGLRLLDWLDSPALDSPTEG